MTPVPVRCFKVQINALSKYTELLLISQARLSFVFFNQKVQETGDELVRVRLIANLSTEFLTVQSCYNKKAVEFSSFTCTVY